MTTILLDTNIISYLFKRDSRMMLYAPLPFCVARLRLRRFLPSYAA
jgi:predicted nucleic acid-binding protein